MRTGGAALVAVGLVVLLLGGMWTGEPSADVAPAEERIQEAMLRVDRAATALDGARAAQRLAGAFRVPARVIADLQDQKLDFGQVAMVLALAEAGRISSDQVLTLWANARLNWEQIAARLRVDVPHLLERLDMLPDALALPHRSPTTP
jgi:hypothetical protein